MCIRDRYLPLPALALLMAFMAAGLDRISICSSKSAIRFRGTMKATTSPFRVMAEVLPLRHSAGNCACPLVMVNVFFMQILHRPFFIFRQVFLTAQERGQCRIKRTLETPLRGTVRAPKLISRKQKGAAD